MPQTMTTTIRERVTLDTSFEPLVGRFMANRQTDAITMLRALETRDWRTLAAISHAVKGAGGTYGFDRISEIAAAIERAALRADAEGIATGVAELSDYLERVEVAYG